MLLVDDRKKCIARASEVPAATLFETFDDSTATLLDYADVALADRKVLPLDCTVFLEVAFSRFGGD